MQKPPVGRLATTLLLLIAAQSQAADHPRAVVSTTYSVPEKNLAQRVIAAPVDLAAFLLMHTLNAAAPASASRGAVAPDAASIIDRYQGLLGSPENHGPMQLILSETRFRLWLRDDVNLQCDLEQDRSVKRGDVFALKLALQFRFR